MKEPDNNTRAVFDDRYFEPDTLGWGFEGARRFHLSLALKMTPAERLNWLSETVSEMQSLCGLAQHGQVRKKKTPSLG